MTQTRSQTLLLRFSQKSSVAVVLIAVAALAGWVFHLDWLKSWTPESVAMNPLSAIFLIICGIASARLLRVGQELKIDRIALVCAWIVTAGGAWKMAEYLFHFDLNLDQLLFRGSLQDTQ